MLSAWPPAPSSTNDRVGPPDWDQAPVVPSSKSTELTMSVVGGAAGAVITMSSTRIVYGAAWLVLPM